ncbi:hypothetical protein NC652_022326 [Populus alba x Populus x berolinensis]|nr:hypothetical protein NC652_022326 [Populus alba x Populus x berolinensis]
MACYANFELPLFWITLIQEGFQFNLIRSGTSLVLPPNYKESTVPVSFNFRSFSTPKDGFRAKNVASSKSCSLIDGGPNGSGVVLLKSELLPPLFEGVFSGSAWSSTCIIGVPHLSDDRVPIPCSVMEPIFFGCADGSDAVRSPCSGTPSTLGIWRSYFCIVIWFKIMDFSDRACGGGFNLMLLGFNATVILEIDSVLLFGVVTLSHSPIGYVTVLLCYVSSLLKRISVVCLLWALADLASDCGSGVLLVSFAELLISSWLKDHWLTAVPPKFQQSLLYTVRFGPQRSSLVLCSWLLEFMLAFASLVAAICRLFAAPLKTAAGFITLSLQLDCGMFLAAGLLGLLELMSGSCFAALCSLAAMMPHICLRFGPQWSSLALCSWLLDFMLAFASLVVAIYRLFAELLKATTGFITLYSWSRVAFEYVLLACNRRACILLLVWLADASLLGKSVVQLLIVRLVGPCSRRPYGFPFCLHGGCPCFCIWDLITFLGLAGARKKVPMYLSFVFSMPLFPRSCMGLKAIYGLAWLAAGSLDMHGLLHGFLSCIDELLFGYLICPGCFLGECYWPMPFTSLHGKAHGWSSGCCDVVWLRARRCCLDSAWVMSSCPPVFGCYWFILFATSAWHPYFAGCAVGFRLIPLSWLGWLVARLGCPDKFLIFVEEGSVPQPIVSSPSTPDHVIVEDCSDKDDYDEDEVDYSAFGGNSKFFRSPVPPSTSNNLDVTLNNVSRVSPLSGPG